MTAAVGSRLRVLMVGPLPPPVGGMATVVANLASAFTGPMSEGVELRVLNNVKTTPPDRHLWQGTASQLGLLWRLAAACLIWRPDVVHIHTCSWFSFWRSAGDVLAARLLLRPVLLHIHGGQFHRFLAGLPPPLAWMARRVLGLSGRVIVLSAGWKRLLDAWTNPEKVIAVPNGVAVRAPVQFAVDEPFRIVCLANLMALKGQSDLLLALARLHGARPAELALIGFEVEAGQRQMLLDLAAQLGVANRVEMPGPMVGADKDDYLRSASCFCLPSYDEGLPMSLLEAMAMGLPVVATRVGAIPEAVSDGREGLLFAPGDIDALAAHLQRLLDDPRQAQAIGGAGRERVLRDFSLENVTSDLLRLYRHPTL